MTKDPESYDVGYRKPPKSSRYKPGESGYKKGRPKGSKNVKTIFKEVFFKKEKIRINGETVKLTAMELMLRQMMSSACKGNLKAIKEVIQLAAKFNLLSDETGEGLIHGVHYGCIVVPAGLTVEEWKAQYEQQEKDK